jgi:hypothetical protein
MPIVSKTDPGIHVNSEPVSTNNLGTVMSRERFIAHGRPYPTKQPSAPNLCSRSQPHYDISYFILMEKSFFTKV